MEFLLFTFLATAVVGDVYVWNGGSMNFSDSKNWLGGLAPPSPVSGEPAPCSTMFGTTSSIITQLDVRVGRPCCVGMLCNLVFVYCGVVCFYVLDLLNF